MLQKWALVILCLGELKGFSEFTASLLAFSSPVVLQRESVSMLTSPGGRLLFHFIWFSELVLAGGNFLSSISPSTVLSKILALSLRSGAFSEFLPLTTWNPKSVLFL